MNKIVELDVLDAPGKADGTNVATSVEIEPSGDGKIINVRGYAAAELFAHGAFPPRDLATS